MCVGIIPAGVTFISKVFLLVLFVQVRAQPGLGLCAARGGGVRLGLRVRRAAGPGPLRLRGEGLPEDGVLPAARAEARDGRQVLQGEPDPSFTQSA